MSVAKNRYNRNSFIFKSNMLAVVDWIDFYLQKSRKTVYVFIQLTSMAINVGNDNNDFCLIAHLISKNATLYRFPHFSVYFLPKLIYCCFRFYTRG